MQAGSRMTPIFFRLTREQNINSSRQTASTSRFRLTRYSNVSRMTQMSTVNAFTVGFQRSSIYSTSSADFSTSAVSSSR